MLSGLCVETWHRFQGHHSPFDSGLLLGSSQGQRCILAPEVGSSAGGLREPHEAGASQALSRTHRAGRVFSDFGALDFRACHGQICNPKKCPLFVCFVGYFEKNYCPVTDSFAVWLSAISNLSRVMTRC